MSESELDPSRLSLVLAVWAAAALALVALVRSARRRDDSRRRMRAEEELDERAGESARGEGERERQGALRRWLALAGLRARAAPAVFVLATAGGIALGLGFAFALIASGALAAAQRTARSLPGGPGDLAAGFLLGAPWIVALAMAAAPALLVRARRNERVRAVEQDLPITLELLATLSEAGLAFDAALEKVLESAEARRPLAAELATFRTESLAGISRVRAFRGLARRLEVPAVTILVSALVQAEQVGAGYARVLRTQADDLRGRRREQATALAEALPVKLMFPLVLCFLPGIFVTTLGPTFLQFVQLADGMMRR